MLQTNFEASYDPASFELVHIDTDNISAGALHAHWDVYNPTFPVLVGCAGLYSQYGNGYIPYNVVLDGNGVVRYSTAGFNQTALHNVIQQYLVLPTPLFDIAGLDILADDNNDGRPDPGETIHFAIRLHNGASAQPATAVSVSWSTTDGSLTPGLVQAQIATLAPGQTVLTSPDFTFTVDPAASPHWATLAFAIQAQYPAGGWSQNLTHPLRIARPTLLLVDSDGTMDDNETFTENALNSLGVTFDLWQPSESGPLPTSVAVSYEQIIWLGGLRNPDISTVERNTLEAFLNVGGLLLLSSQYASSDPLNLPFLQQWFGVTVSQTNGGNIYWATTTGGDPWYGGMDYVMTGAVAANNNVHPDVINVVWPTEQMAYWRQGSLGGAAAYRISGGYNAVFCGYPIEAMRTYSAIPGAVSQAAFLQRVLDFHAANPPSPPAPVTDLRLTTDFGLLTLNWSYVPTAISYRIYESPTPWSFPAEAAWETGENYIDMEQTDTRRFYQVRAVR